MHIAAHGGFSRVAPFLQRRGSGRRAFECLDLLQSTPLRLAHVTLSACDTGLNLVAPGDELLGLARALLSMRSSHRCC
ncbi:MAG: CHAT domain-containing protein [Caldilineaceae bacterium]